MIAYSPIESPTLHVVGEIKVIATRMGLRCLPSPVCSLGRSEGGTRWSRRANRLLSTAVGPRRLHPLSLTLGDGQFLPCREQRQAAQEHGDHEGCSRSQAVPQLPTYPREWKGEKTEACGDQAVGDTAHFFWNAPGDERAEGRFECRPSNTEQDPREGEPREPSRHQENDLGEELCGYAEHDAQPLAGLINQPSRRIAGHHPGDPEDAVQKTDVALGQTPDIGQVDWHQFEGDFQGTVARGVGDQDPGDQPTRDGQDRHLTQRAFQRGQVCLPLSGFIRCSTHSGHDQEDDGCQSGGDRRGDEHPPITIGLRQYPTERRAEDPGQRAGGLGETKDTAAHLLRGMVGDVRVVGGDRERGCHRQGCGGEQGHLPAWGECIDTEGQHAGHAADLHRPQPTDRIRDPATEDAQQEREDQRDGEEQSDLADVGAQLAQEDRHLDGDHTARGLDEEHRHQEDRHLSRDERFLRRFRHLGYPGNQGYSDVKCTGEMRASVAKLGWVTALAIVTPGAREGNLKEAFYAAEILIKRGSHDESRWYQHLRSLQHTLLHDASGFTAPWSRRVCLHDLHLHQDRSERRLMGGPCVGPSC
jgi:hypothetical protein